MGNIFDILGPVMVGPSSSHTAGAVRIGMVARQLFGRQPERAEVYLHGSFAATGKGHGTDRALIAVLLGMMPDDMRIPDSYEVAKDMGMDFVMKNKNIKGAHPNTAQIIMEAEGVPQMKIQAHSIGGGRICVCKLDGIDVNFSGESCTLIIRNVDEPGRIMEVAAALSKAEINVATMQVFRDKRGGTAVMVVETDQVIPQSAISVKSYSKEDLKMGSVNGFEIVKAKVLIDTTQIGVGTTWLTMHFENGNVSPKEEGTLVVKVTVCEYGQIELASMQETIVLDVSGAGLSDSLYTVRVCDGDYVDGSSVPAAKDYTLTAEDGKLRISFDYTVGHEYWIRVSAGEADDYNTPLLIGAKETEGAKYTGDTTLPGTGSLTFTLADQVLELVVTAA